MTTFVNIARWRRPWGYFCRLFFAKQSFGQNEERSR